MTPLVSCDGYKTENYDKVPYLETISVLNEDETELTILQSIVHVKKWIVCG